MSLYEDIDNAVNGILSGNVISNDTSVVPDILDSEITFGLTAKRFKNVCFYIDMRGSTAILEKHNANVVIKIHKAFFITILKIVKDNGGEIRSFNGDSVLAFFLGDNSNTIEAAVKSAMQISFMLINAEDSLKSKVLDQYQTTIDIGIGLDFGTTYVAKIGQRDINSRDLIWIGSNVNHSVKISDERESPDNIGITRRLYDKLPDWLKYSNGKNIWSRLGYEYNGFQEEVFVTNYHCEV